MRSLCKINKVSTLNWWKDACKDLKRDTYARDQLIEQRIIADYWRCVESLLHSTGPTFVQSSWWSALSYRENLTGIRGSRKNSSWVEPVRCQWFALRPVRRFLRSCCEFRGGLDDPRWRPTRARTTNLMTSNYERTKLLLLSPFFFFSFFCDRGIGDYDRKDRPARCWKKRYKKARISDESLNLYSVWTESVPKFKNFFLICDSAK